MYVQAMSEELAQFMMLQLHCLVLCCASVLLQMTCAMRWHLSPPEVMQRHLVGKGWGSNRAGESCTACLGFSFVAFYGSSCQACVKALAERVDDSGECDFADLP